MKNVEPNPKENHSLAYTRQSPPTLRSAIRNGLNEAAYPQELKEFAEQFAVENTIAFLREKFQVAFLKAEASPIFLNELRELLGEIEKGEIV